MIFPIRQPYPRKAFTFSDEHPCKNPYVRVKYAANCKLVQVSNVKFQQCGSARYFIRKHICFIFVWGLQMKSSVDYWSRFTHCEFSRCLTEAPSVYPFHTEEMLTWSPTNSYFFQRKWLNHQLMDVSVSLRRHALHQEKEKIVVAKLIPKNGLEKMNKSVGSTILYTIYALVKPIERQFLDLLLCKRTLCIDKNQFVGLCNLNFATNLFFTRG